MDVKVIAVILLAAIAFAPIIEIIVEDDIRVVVDYTEARPGKVWELLVNAENIGSATCPARLKLETRSGKFWTEEVVMRPGEINLFTIPYLTNETEEARAYLHFCDQIVDVGNFTVTPTSLVPGNVSAKAWIEDGYLFLRGNVTAIPLSPKNAIVPVASGDSRVRIESPEDLDEMRILVFNSTHYSIITAKRVPPLRDILSRSLVVLAGMLAGMVIGRLLNA